MDTDKPSNQSSGSSSSDDLIEEMARLMAKGAKKNAESATTQTQLRNPLASTGAPGTASASASAAPVSQPATPSAAPPAREFARAALTPQTPAPTPQTPAQSASASTPPKSAPISAVEFSPSSDAASSAARNPFAARPGAPAPYSPPTAKPAVARPPTAMVEPAQASAPLQTPASSPIPTPAPATPVATPATPVATPATPVAAASPVAASGAPVAEPARAPAQPAQLAPGQPARQSGGANLSGGNLPDSGAHQRPARTSQAAEVDDPIGELIRSQASSGGAPTPAAPALSVDQPAERDEFKVSPVFGLGGDRTSEPSVHTTGSDTLDEIENLIGNAAHVGMSAEAAPVEAELGNQDSFSEGPNEVLSAMQENLSASQSFEPDVPPTVAAPLRPNAHTDFQPSRSRHDIPDAGVAAAEAAIMGAIGTGPNDGPKYDDDDPFVPYALPGETSLSEGGEPEAQSAAWRRFVVPVVALLFLGGAGYAGYSVLNTPSEEGDAPIILASSEPTRQEPIVENTTTADQSIVLDGASDQVGETLVSRDQSDTAAIDPIRQIITEDTTDTGLANRKVRTVTVRPDGTIIRGDDQVAGGEALPVDRPDVPDLPADAITSELANTTLTSLVQDDQIAPLALTTDNSAALTTLPTNLIAVDGDRVPFPVSRLANLEQRRQAAQAAAVVQTTVNNTTTQALDLLGNQVIAPLTPAATTTPTASAAGEPAAWVQLASQRSQSEADQSAATIQRQFSTLLSGQNIVVRRADLGARGIFYRVLIPSNSLSDAAALCRQIQNAGGNCFPKDNS